MISPRIQNTKPHSAPGILTLLSPYAREDRETRQSALHRTRLFAFPEGWVGDAFLYRINA